MQEDIASPFVVRGEFPTAVEYLTELEAKSVLPCQ